MVKHSVISFRGPVSQPCQPRKQTKMLKKASSSHHCVTNHKLKSGYLFIDCLHGVPLHMDCNEISLLSQTTQPKRPHTANLSFEMTWPVEFCNFWNWNVLLDYDISSMPSFGPLVHVLLVIQRVLICLKQALVPEFY